MIDTLLTDVERQTLPAQVASIQDVVLRLLAENKSLTTQLLHSERETICVEDRLVTVVQCLDTLVHWHSDGSGHIDESWWGEARRLVALEKVKES